MWLCGLDSSYWVHGQLEAKPAGSVKAWDFFTRWVTVSFSTKTPCRWVTYTGLCRGRTQLCAGLPVLQPALQYSNSDEYAAFIEITTWSEKNGARQRQDVRNKTSFDPRIGAGKQGSVTSWKVTILNCSLYLLSDFCRSAWWPPLIKFYCMSVWSLCGTWILLSVTFF
jgi:hypothetical protein